MPEQDFLEGHVHPQGPASHSLCCHLLDTFPFSLHSSSKKVSTELSPTESWMASAVLSAREHLFTIHARAVQQGDCLCNQTWSCSASQSAIGGWELSWLTWEVAIIFPTSYSVEWNISRIVSPYPWGLVKGLSQMPYSVGTEPTHVCWSACNLVQVTRYTGSIVNAM